MRGILANPYRGYGPLTAGSPPATPTLSVTDNGDGTGAVATISGSAPGSTTSVDVVGLAANGSLSWTNAGSRSGDGTVSLALADGHYLATAVSTLNGLDSAPSNPYEFFVTGGATQPSIRAAVYSYLSTHAGITALVGSSPARVCPVHLPETFARPALLYAREKGGHDHNLAGSAGRALARFRFECLGDTYAQCDALAEAVRDATDGAINETYGGVTILGMTIDEDEGDQDDYYPPIDASDAGIYVIRLFYDVMYLESVPTP